MEMCSWMCDPAMSALTATSSCSLPVGAYIDANGNGYMTCEVERFTLQTERALGNLFLDRCMLVRCTGIQHDNPLHENRSARSQASTIRTCNVNVCVCVCVCVCVLRQEPQVSPLELFISYRHRAGVHIRWLLIALGPYLSIALRLASCCATTSMVTVLLLKRQRDENRTRNLHVAMLMVRFESHVPYNCLFILLCGSAWYLSKLSNSIFTLLRKIARRLDLHFVCMT